MAVTESERHQLFESAKAVFGESSAEIFMNLHPNVEWETLATKDDLAQFRAEWKSDVASLETRLQNRFVTVLLASQGVLLAAITLVVTLAAR
jgi:hypothetical protein